MEAVRAVLARRVAGRRVIALCVDVRGFTRFARVVAYARVCRTRDELTLRDDARSDIVAADTRPVAFARSAAIPNFGIPSDDVVFRAKFTFGVPFCGVVAASDVSGQIRVSNHTQGAFHALGDGNFFAQSANPCDAIREHFSARVVRFVCRWNSAERTHRARPVAGVRDHVVPFVACSALGDVQLDVVILASHSSNGTFLTHERVSRVSRDVMIRRAVTARRGV